MRENMMRVKKIIIIGQIKILDAHKFVHAKLSHEA